MQKPLILILCTGNSCRSQMAEAFLRAAAGDILDAASAGSDPAGFVHPQAVEVMREAGFDLSAARSKHLSEFLDAGVTAVVTVCGRAEQACPVFPGSPRRYHFPFEDPAAFDGAPEERAAVFRRVRDQIRAVFEAFAAGFREGLALRG